MAVSGDVNLARELHNWAVNSMHFIPHGRHTGAKLPTVDDFRFVCRGQMNEIWRFIIDRVHSAQMVRMVRGNLTIKKLQEKKGYVVKFKSKTTFDSGQAERYEEKAGLVSELKSVMAAVQHVQRDVERLQREIATAEHTYQARLCQIREAQCKKALLNAHSQCTADEVARIEEFAARIQRKSRMLKDLRRKFSEPPVMISSTKSGNAGLETVCTKAVRESCEVIGAFLQRLLQGSFEGNETTMNQEKEKLWNSVESVLADFTASELLTALSVHADTSAANLQQKTASVDIRRDAEQLRFKYENEGQLCDISTPPTVLQSVHQLLEENQAAIFNRFLETEDHLNNAWKLQKRLAEATAVLDDALRRQYDNSGALQLARTILETETRLASGRAAVKALETVSAELAVKIAKATSDKEILYAKYQKIQDFKKIADIKQNLIRVLVKQNMNARMRLVTQQSENVQYVNRALGGHESDMQQFTEKLTDGVSVEVAAFSRLSLSLLPTVTTDSGQKMAPSDLSIYKLGNIPSAPCSHTISTLLTSLEIPCFTASECLLPRIVEVQNEWLHTSLVLKTSTSAQDTEDVQSAIRKLAKLRQDVSQHDKDLINRLLPVLRQRLSEATQTLTDCLEVKDTASNWWEQPAQTCTPWMTVDGMNLQQWRDKWTVLATRLRQLPVSGQ